MTSQTAIPALAQTQSDALAGLYVVITQTEDESTEFARLLRDRGAISLFYPCIRFAPPPNLAALDDAIQHAVAGKFDWLVLAGTSTVNALAERLATAQLNAADLADLRVAAVGNEIAQAAAAQLGLSVETVPDEFAGTGLAQAAKIEPGQRVFLPQSALAKPDLANALTDAGADVTVVTADRAVRAEGGDDVPTLLWQGKIDVVTFTSGSTIRYFRKRLDVMGANLGMLQDVVVACIDPGTAKVAHQFGLQARVTPEVHTVEGLVASLETYFSA